MVKKVSNLSIILHSSIDGAGCKDIIAPDSQPILLLDSDSEEYFSVGDGNAKRSVSVKNWVIFH